MFNNITPIVKQLLIINIVCFVMSQFVNGSYELFSLYYFENAQFKIWQPLTHMFMHSNESFMHILFNMYALVSFGSIIEHFWGAKRFLFFYFICGFGAFLLHTILNYYYFHNGLDILIQNGYNSEQIKELLNNRQIDTNWHNVLNPADFSKFASSYINPAVGASGAIYGLLVAFAFMFPNAELSLMFIPIPIKAKYFVPIMIVLYDGFFGIFGESFISGGSGVAHFAHIGGAITGLILMYIWKNKKFKHNRWN